MGERGLLEQGRTFADAFGGVLIWEDFGAVWGELDIESGKTKVTSARCCH